MIRGLKGHLRGRQGALAGGFNLRPDDKGTESDNEAIGKVVEVLFQPKTR